MVHSREPFFDPAGELSEIDAATDKFITTASRLTETMLNNRSLLPDWTRGHVLAHVARNADSLVNLLAWARTGRRTPQYPSLEVRNKDIETASVLPLSTLVEDLRASAGRFESAVAQLPAKAWAARVRIGIDGAGAEIPASRVLWQRRKEVEIHHVDLDAGYGPDDWPEDFVDRALEETCRRFGESAEVAPFAMHATDTNREYFIRDRVDAPRVSGSQAALLAWLTGRSKGDDLRLEPAGMLPVVPPWA